MSSLRCPMCNSDQTSLFHQQDFSEDLNCRKAVEYYSCNSCHIVFLAPHCFLTKVQEKAHYDTHQNNPEDPGYRRFLDKLFIPLTALIDGKASGLDYGSGPGPTLSLMFEEQGHAMNIYDYIYAADASVLEKPYDFISCTETIEHFQNPKEEFSRIWQCLKPDGYLGLMTQFYNSNIDFSSWRYRRDPTHVCFYTAQTIDWICKQFNARKVYQQDDVVILQKLNGNNDG